MKIRGALVMAVIAAALAMLPTVAGGQAAPTMTVTPLRAGPDDTITIVIEDCTPPDDLPVPYGVSITTGFEDTPGGMYLTEGPAGRWTGTLKLGADFRVSTSCEGVSLRADVEIDNPILYAKPLIIPLTVRPDPPTGFFGTDCPDGTEAHVRFQALGRPAPEVRTAAIDEHGDWEVDVPDFPQGTAVEVSASCGSVSYPTYSYTAGGSQYATTTSTIVSDPGSSTTTTAAASAGSAAPATPVTGAAAYTG